nr:hypothetical protein [uncultured Nocardioides sp.]
MTSTDTLRDTTGHRRPRVDRTLLVGVLTGCSVALTALTGLVVGWFAVTFQIGGRADADDYAVAAGAYGATTLALLLGAVAFRRWATTTWQLPVTLVLAIVPGLLAVRAVADATHAEPGIAMNGWWDGAGGVLACPWTWWLVAVGVRALVTGDRRVSE